jgi:tetratricopeptide (TPR) repeat protein
VNRGIAYGNKGDNDHALADYNEAIRLDPKNAVPFLYRGIAYGKKGDKDRALADFNEAIRLDPNNADALWIRGNLRVRLNDTGGNADMAKAEQVNPLVGR